MCMRMFKSLESRVHCVGRKKAHEHTHAHTQLTSWWETHDLSVCSESGSLECVSVCVRLCVCHSGLLGTMPHLPLEWRLKENSNWEKDGHSHAHTHTHTRILLCTCPSQNSTLTRTQGQTKLSLPCVPEKWQCQLSVTFSDCLYVCSQGVKTPLGSFTQSQYDRSSDHRRTVSPESTRTGFAPGSVLQCALWYVSSC